jgi:hypothetical protein
VERHHHSTCPQCLEAGARQIEKFDSQPNDYANSTHYAWQAGVQSADSMFFFQDNPER